MTYSLWDKASPIYDITAEQAMINNPKYRDEDSFLFFRDNGNIYDILPISTLRELTGKDGTATDEEVCDAFIAKLAEPEPEPSEDLTGLTAKVADLEEQLAAAKILLGVD